MADRPPHPGTPRWVKVFGIIGIVVVLLVIVLLLFGGGPGGHGPGRHTRQGDTPPIENPMALMNPLIEHGVQQP